MNKIIESISYYKNIVTTYIRIEELKKLKTSGKKIVGIFCNFAPLELIYACDLIPIRLCAGSYNTIHPAEEILPRDICPLIKSSFGLKLLKQSYFELCDLVIIPTTCDGKMKLGEILSDYLPVWVLNVPHIKNIQIVKNFWLNEVKTLKEKLEQFSRTKITADRLKNSIKKLYNRQKVFRKLLQLRTQEPPLINGRDFLFITQASFYDDIDRWTEKTEQLCEELSTQIKDKIRQQNDLHKPRLLLTGAPIIWPNWKILNVVEEAGAVIVADDICSGTQALYDLVEVDEWTQEAMLIAIATRYLLPTVCPCFIESNDRIDKILNLINEFNIDGVVYHSLRLCQLYDIESYRIRQILKERKIPMLDIHTDYSQEDIEQIKTRVEAFLEMIKTK